MKINLDIGGMDYDKWLTMKTRLVLLVVALSLSVQVFSAEQAAPMMKEKVALQEKMKINQPRCYSAAGVVRKIDRAGGIVTIFYDAVPALLWAPMTMPFAVREDGLFEHLVVGKRIAFEFELEEKTGVIISVKQE